MTPQEYQKRALAKEADQEDLREWVYSQGSKATRMQNGLNGLVDEVGELADQIKGWLEYKRSLDGVNIKEEVGDCLWRLAQISKAAGFTLEDAMFANLVKLEKVRYKDTVCDSETSKEENRNREKEADAVRRAYAEDSGVHPLEDEALGKRFLDVKEQ